MRPFFKILLLASFAISRTLRTALGAGSIGFSVILACAASPQLLLAAAQPPNILLITADDLGYQLGCYGEKSIATPHLDALAASGILFQNGYVAQSSCSASRAALLTGRWPHQNRNIGHSHLGFRVKSDEVSLPKLLRDAGYFTGVFGKLHVEPEKLLPFEWKAARPAGASGYDVRWHAESAQQFLRKAKNTGKPFFLYANYFDPHGPYTDKITQVKGLPEKPLTGADITQPMPFSRVKKKNAETTATFLNCVSRLDTGIGLLMNELLTAGQRENTLIIFIGDNGPPGIHGKTTSYEYGVRVPYLVSWPGHIPPAQKRDALVTTLDIMPTILQAAQVAPGPLPLGGQALQPLFADAQAEWRKYLFTEMNFHDARMYHPQRTVRGERWKLIANLNPTDKETPPLELYDLEKDPQEARNLIDDEKAARPRQWLQNKLNEWQEQTDDPLRHPATQENWSRLAAEWRTTAKRSTGPYAEAGAIPEGDEPRLWK
jgi:N-sulfoglucosamine sulfohydrolase